MDYGCIDFDLRFLMSYYDSGQPCVDGVLADHDCFAVVQLHTYVQYTYEYSNSVSHTF